jgi:hypothetical protein
MTVCVASTEALVLLDEASTSVNTPEFLADRTARGCVSLMNGRRLHKWTCLTLAVLCLSGYLPAVFAQKPPPVVLEVDLENFVQFWDDSTDPSKLASVPNRTTTAPRVFMQNVWVADVVAVNGKPARGTYVNRTQSFGYRPSPMPGQNIADISRNGGPATDSLEILHPNGTPIGTIMGMGLVAGTPPPGSPSAMRFGNTAIVGGTGAFFGVRGQCGIAMGENLRNASQTEDPSLRRVHGGGTMRMVLYLIPMFRPDIIASASGPGCFPRRLYSSYIGETCSKRGNADCVR